MERIGSTKFDAGTKDKTAGLPQQADRPLPWAILFVPPFLLKQTERAGGPTGSIPYFPPNASSSISTAEAFPFKIAIIFPMVAGTMVWM